MENEAAHDITPNSWHYPFCGAEFPSYEETVSHSAAEHGITW